MYEILSETLILTYPQQNDTNVMSPNDKGLTFFIEQKDNSMYLKDHEMDKNEQESLMDDPLFTLLKDLRLENPGSLIFSHVNINSLEKEENAPFVILSIF